MGYRTWTDDQLKNAINNCETISQVLKELGLSSQNAGNYKTVQTRIKLLGLDTSHFKSNKFGHYFRPELNLDDVLVKNSSYTNTVSLKRKLLKHNVFEEKCAKCGISKWHGKKLSLHLDHINGINNDNRFDNLRLLCPNCHSLTSTYCRGTRRAKQNLCDCGKKISKLAKKCSSCYGDSRKNSNCKIKWPSVEKLIALVKETNYCQVARFLGVSDNAVRKRISTYLKEQRPFKSDRVD